MKNNREPELINSPLGQSTVYVETYTPELLFPIPRTIARDKIGISGPLPFDGIDIWNGYELSWINSKGKPQIALAEFIFPCSSPSVVESKSFKLYLNSFNQSVFDSLEQVEAVIRDDLSKAAGAPIKVALFLPSSQKKKPLEQFSGFCLDSLDIETDVYQVDKNFLTTENEEVEESLYSDLLKSNCLATGQPDWGSVFVRYKGAKINREGLLKYFISFRRHSGFAEHCAEQIFYDITTQCHPRFLTVYCRYTRRGGLDINPYRSNFENMAPNSRHIRQ